MVSEGRGDDDFDKGLESKVWCKINYKKEKPRT